MGVFKRYLQRNDLTSNTHYQKRRQKIAESLKWRLEEIFFVQKELSGLHCEWDVDHQDMDKIDEMKHLPGG